MTTHTNKTDPYWYKDAIIYEVHVRAFADSNDDGIGDFKGLTTKLDYLQDLGVTAIWLLPFYPSPLKDDGYDIADYTGVHPRYGTLSDVKTLIREAHRRGLKIVTELVLNHTSDQHPWFQRARHAPPGSAQRDFYVWSDDPGRYEDARIIFQDFETSNWTWDPVAESYYWHRFYSHQPDLNFESPQVRRAVFRVVDFWLKLGVDGLRLDAVPYLYEREGTTGENLHTTHDFLKQLRAHIDARFPGRMLLAEANQWPEDAVASFSRRALYQSLRNLTGRTLATLRRQLHTLPAAAAADATQLLDAEAALLKRFQTVLKHPMPGPRIRTHGDYHLEQILHTDADLLIIDFEGEPSRMLAYRRLRHSPLQDVVAMIRSFFDAATTVAEQASSPQRNIATAVTHAWAQWAAAAFLKAYLKYATPHELVPKQPAHLERLLDIFLLERVLYEVAYELNNRPARTGIALRGAALMLGAPVQKAEAQLR
jgi:hypothetical protein